MYEYLKGTIVSIKPDYIVLENNGIGYLILTPYPYQYKQEEAVQIFIEQIVRESELTLYGFKNLEDKQLFNLLNRVSGIGPRSALAIMASEDVSGLAAAVDAGDIKYLMKFPGIGKKTASQIVLDLQGKMAIYQDDSLETADQMKSQPASGSKEFDESLQALQALGYTQREIDKISPKLKQTQLNKVDEYVKEGLRLLLKK
ncbi:Holliday junction branch migration protein RuvA [Holzapfeliella sp. He02]|uniref:Holliday junction branch migration complex subunit RuvA n=1 Tax=Holzapfeliella saturejae TaxID=3082953 RepID=A0ABU8SFL1_9LACO